MQKIAIFDVDYTLTSSETLYEIYKYLIKKDLKNLKYIPKAALSGLLYLTKIKPLKDAKETFFSFVKGKSEEELNEFSKRIYNDVLEKLLYKDAIKEIKKRKEEGCYILLISASAEFYLYGLYNIPEVDHIIGTRLDIENGIYNGKILGENSKGDEKVLRMNDFLKNKSMIIDLENSYMYSDSLSDDPLLRIVGHPYLINYKKKNPKYEVLFWK